MAIDTSEFIAQWGVAVDASNRGDLGPLTEQLAPDCVWLSSAGPVGNSRDEILQAVKTAQDAGWSGHRVLGLVGGGEFVFGIYRNDYADGSSHIAGAVLRLDERGKMSEMRSLEPPRSSLRPKARPRTTDADGVLRGSTDTSSTLSPVVRRGLNPTRVCTTIDNEMPLGICSSHLAAVVRARCSVRAQLGRDLSLDSFRQLTRRAPSRRYGGALGPAVRPFIRSFEQVHGDGHRSRGSDLHQVVVPDRTAL